MGARTNLIHFFFSFHNYDIWLSLYTHLLPPTSRVIEITLSNKAWKHDKNSPESFWLGCIHVLNMRTQPTSLSHNWMPNFWYSGNVCQWPDYYNLHIFKFIVMRIHIIYSCRSIYIHLPTSRFIKINRIEDLYVCSKITRLKINSNPNVCIVKNPSNSPIKIKTLSPLFKIMIFDEDNIWLNWS